MNSNIPLKFSVVGCEFNPEMKKVKGKGISFSDMQAYRRKRAITSLILKLSARWR